MRLLASLLVLNVQLYYIFAFLPELAEQSADRVPDFNLGDNQNGEGYECGGVFLRDLEVREALSTALASVDRGFTFPQRYLGKLYVETKYNEYLLWPIRKGTQMLPQSKYPGTSFRIVFTRDSKDAIDVVSKITSDEYTKCIRRGSPRMERLNLVPENSNGYLCGHNFFADKFIQEYISENLDKIRERKINLIPYTGPLYPSNSRYWILPFLSNRYVISKKSNVGLYSLIINEDQELIDFVVKGYSKNLLRCIRSWKPPKAPTSDPLSKLFVPPPNSGYQCGRIFFSDKTLEDNAEIAKNHLARGIYPQEYSGYPFYEPCLIWPIYKDGKLFRKGFRGPFRLFFTPDYKVKGMAFYVNGQLKACERKTIKAKKFHDSSDYDCDGRYYSHQKLAKAASEACKKLNVAKKFTYPARYEGPGFELDGPYFIFPVVKEGSFKRHSGLDRVVIDGNCEVVGALTTIVYSITQKTMVNCRKVNDNQLSLGLKINNN